MIALRAHEPHPRNRSRERARRGAAGRGESRYHAGGGSAAATSTRPIPPASAPAPSAAMWRRTPAGRTRWPTASPPITCWGSKCVLPDGTVVDHRRQGDRTCPGYDLTGLLTGSEGTMALVTKIIVRLMRKPEDGQDAFSRSTTPTTTPADTVAEITARAITPVAVEMLDGVMLRMVEEATHAGYPMDAAAVLLIELEGLSESGGRAGGADPRGVRSRCGAREFRVARTAEERDLLWKGRKNAFGAVGRVSPTYYVQDGVVPRTKIAPTLRFIGEVADKLRADHQQHFPRGRRQPASHHSVRRAQAGRTGAGAGGGRRDSAILHRGGRLDHRRARRRHGEERADGQAVPAGDAGDDGRAEAAFDPRTPESRQRCCPPGAAAWRFGRCR